MRRFIRHQTDLPIAYQLHGKLDVNQKPMKNFSEGGLCFIADEWIEPDAEIHLSIQMPSSPFQALATVVWCKPMDGHYEVGVRFQDEATELAMRMAEQFATE